jgi:hypothetical protein
MWLVALVFRRRKNAFTECPITQTVIFVSHFFKQHCTTKFDPILSVCRTALRNKAQRDLLFAQTGLKKLLSGVLDPRPRLPHPDGGPGGLHHRPSLLHHPQEGLGNLDPTDQVSTLPNVQMLLPTG